MLTVHHVQMFNQFSVMFQASTAPFTSKFTLSLASEDTSDKSQVKDSDVDVDAPSFDTSIVSVSFSF